MAESSNSNKNNLVIAIAGVVFLLIASALSWMSGSASADTQATPTADTLVITLNPGFNYGSAECQIGASAKPISSSNTVLLKTALQTALAQKTSVIIQANANIHFKEVSKICQLVQGLTASQPGFVTHITNITTSTNPEEK